MFMLITARSLKKEMKPERNSNNNKTIAVLGKKNIININNIVITTKIITKLLTFTVK